MKPSTRKKGSSVTEQRLRLTDGPIWKGILLFALPVLLGNLFQQFYNAFDSWCVGNYIGEDALAAVGSSGSLIFMMVSFFNGLAMGAGVVGEMLALQIADTWLNTEFSHDARHQRRIDKVMALEK